MDDIAAYRDILRDVRTRLKDNYIHTQKYKQEFDDLKTHSDGLMLVQSRDEGWLQYNRCKNRYKDILPYDRSRVRLPTINNIAGSDYINACHISGPKGYSSYIAAQGPLANTVFDFWRTVWYNYVAVIVMVCREFEMGKEKCKNYWGKAVGDTQKWGNFKVQLLNEKHEDNYVVRSLILTCAEVSREVHQYQYLDWPDRGVPFDSDPLNSMLRLVRDTCPEKKSNNNPGSPILIHCSAGCGRTGTVLGIDYIDTIIKQHKINRDFSVYEMIRGMRTERVAICQTKQQYGFVYYTAIQLLDAAIETLDHRSGTVTETIYENVPISPLLNDNPWEDEDNKPSKPAPPAKPPKPERPTSTLEILHEPEYADQQDVDMMSGYASMDMVAREQAEKTGLKPTLSESPLTEEHTANKPPKKTKSSPPAKPPKPSSKPSTPATPEPGNNLGVAETDEPLYAAIDPSTRTGKLIDIEDEEEDAPPLPASPTFVPVRGGMMAPSSPAPVRSSSDAGHLPAAVRSGLLASSPSSSDVAPSPTREQNRFISAARFDEDNSSELSIPHSDATDSLNPHSSTEDVEDDDEDLYETFDTVDAPGSKSSKDNSLQKTGGTPPTSKKFSMAGKKLKPKGFGFKGLKLIANMSDSAHIATQNLKQRSTNLSRATNLTHTNTPATTAAPPPSLPEFHYISEFGKRTGKPTGPRDMPAHWIKI